MSYEAINWAFAQKTSKSSAKFVLVAMANLAGGDMTCWPSCRHLVDATCQDVKTVEASLRRLRAEGFISDTGDRKGSTGQVIVYRLNTPEFGGLQPQPKTPVIPSNTPVIGGLKEKPKTPVFPGNTPVFPVKHPRFSHETPPKTGDGTTNEPPRNPKEPSVKTDDFADLLVGVEPQVLLDWKALRKTKKATITRTAVLGICREAAKAGVSVNDALSTCCTRGWTGFNADWVGAKQGSSTASRAPSRHGGFNQLNYREGVTEDGSLA